MNTLRNVFLLLSLIFVGWSGISIANEEQSQRKQTLIIGRVSDNPGEHIKYLRPIGEYAVSKLVDLGINKIEIIFARNNQEMINFIKTGQVDWITESVYSALIFEKQSKARIFLKRWKKNSAEYHTVFITRKDSSIDDLNHLHGKTLVLEDNSSTSGFFLPIIELMKINIPVTHLPSHSNTLLDNQVRYVFAKNEINISTWVLKGLAHAGAYSNTDWESEAQTPLAMKKDLKVFSKTANYPRMLELLAPHVSKKVEAELARVLLEAEFDEEGIRALKKYQLTTRFELLDKPALDSIEKARLFLPKVEDLSMKSHSATIFQPSRL